MVPIALLPRTCELYSLRCANALFISFHLRVEKKKKNLKNEGTTRARRRRNLGQRWRDTHRKREGEREIERDKENIRSLETCEVPHASLCSIFACLFQVRSVFAIEVHLCTIKHSLFTLQSTPSEHNFTQKSSLLSSPRFTVNIS